MLSLQHHFKKWWNLRYFRVGFLLLTLGLITFGGFALQDPDLSKPQDYSAYISAFTTGEISRTGVVRVILNFDPPEAGTPGSEADPSLLSFSPNLEGKLIWLNRRTLEFRPSQWMPSGQEYIVSLDLKALNKEVPRKLRKFVFKFRTFKQHIAFYSEGFRPYSYYDKVTQQLKGYVVLKDVPDTGKIREILRAELDGKSLPINWKIQESNHGSSKQYYFSIDSIVRTQHTRPLQISINGEPIGATTNENRVLDVPAMGDFATEEVRVESEPEQVALLIFSDPLHPNQNLDGIITMDGEEAPRLVISENTIRVYPARALLGDHTIRINKGLKNVWGFHMNQEEVHDVRFRPLNPNVRISSKGVILPSSGKWLFPFEAVNVKAVEVTIYKLYENNVLQFLQVNDLEGQRELYRVAREVVSKKIPLKYNKEEELKTWKSYAIDLQSILKREPGALYRVQLTIHRKDALCDCEEQPQNEEESSEEGYYVNRQRDDWGWDYPWDSEYEYYSDPCERYFFPRRRGHNVMASDLGLVAKADPNLNYHFFVHDLTSTQPIANARITLYDFQQQKIWEGYTDQAGMNMVALKKRPFVAVVSNNNQKGYLKLDEGSSLSLSNFDVSGVHNKEGIKGFLYAERGVWRPGDSIYLCFMLEDKLKQLPPNHPLTMELYDPQGQLAKKQVITQSLHGLYDLRTATDEQARTGNWMAKVKIGNQTFSKVLKVETVKPNRLKINLDFPLEQISRSNPNDTATLKVRWLHGANAPNLQATVEANVTAGFTRFKDYPNLCFDDPVRQFHAEQVMVFDGKVDANGAARFRTKLELGEEAPGMLRAHFNTRVFEEGGNFSVDRFSVDYSPFSTYVGLGTSSNKQVLASGEKEEFRIVKVNEKGKAKAGKVEVKIYKLDWRWWWDRYDDDLNYYLSRASVYPILDSTMDLPGQSMVFKWGANNNEWGRFLIRIKDLESGHMTGKVVFFDAPWWSRESGNHSEFATMLNFSANKNELKVGEPIRLSIPSPAKGKALITVENGQKVLKKFWVDAKAGETRVEIPTTAEMAPNCFVFVSLIQPHGQVKNDLPIRLYGIMQFKVEHPGSHLQPLIAMANVLQPESNAQITVSEAKGKAMTYTLALVDEGLLDLTRFKTPDPWQEFYASEALGIKTWDLHDWVIGAYGGNLNSILSIGGDGALINGQGAKANRFPPVVRFLGPFHLPAGKKATHQVSLPAYVGSLRVMVVAGEDRAYGSAEKTVPVKKPLMVLTTLPRVLGPGEEISVPVNVFAMEDHVKDVKVSIETSDNLKTEGPLTQQLHFDQTGDEVTYFRIKVPMALGTARVKIRAVAGKESATEEIEIAIRPSSPLEALSYGKELKPGESWELPLNLNGLDGSNSLSLEMSSLPVNISKRLNYLIYYPHGCIEQTTSAAFPQLALLPLSINDPAAQQEMASNIKAAIKRLRFFQTGSGGMAYWPGSNTVNSWGTTYAGHFMLEAEKMGYALPVNWKSRWIKYQQQQARNWQINNNNYDNELSQTYRLYTLALAGSPELGAMNRLQEEKNLSNIARWQLAATYALAGQLPTAKRLVDQLEVKQANYVELSGNFGSGTRDEALVMETLLLLQEKEKAEVLMKRIGEALRSNTWMSTQTTAYGLLAVVKYMRSQPSSEQISLAYSWGEKQASTKARGLGRQLVLKNAPAEKGTLSIKNNGSGVVFLQVTQSGFKQPGTEQPLQKQLQLSINYFDKEGRALQPSKLAMGTEFMAEVTIKNPYPDAYLEEMALTQVFPSGWEIRNSRMEEGGAGLEQSSFTYQDLRDDRVMTYFNLYGNAEVKFRVLLIASYAGRYYLSGPEAEVMYDNNYMARGSGQWVEVTAPSPLP